MGGIYYHTCIFISHVFFFFFFFFSPPFFFFFFFFHKFSVFTPPGNVFAPRYPQAKAEGWWLVVGDVEENSILAVKRVQLDRVAKAKVRGIVVYLLEVMQQKTKTKKILGGGGGVKIYSEKVMQRRNICLLAGYNLVLFVISPCFLIPQIDFPVPETVGERELTLFVMCDS